jgi:hypothetical protein
MAHLLQQLILHLLLVLLHVAWFPRGSTPAAAAAGGLRGFANVLSHRQLLHMHVLKQASSFCSLIAPPTCTAAAGGLRGCVNVLSLWTGSTDCC